jgi:hypothetical protein
MHGQIDAASRECFFNFFCEHTLSADLGQSDVSDFVAGGVDDFDFDRVSARAKKRGNVVGLPEC